MNCREISFHILTYVILPLGISCNPYLGKLADTPILFMLRFAINCCIIEIPYSDEVT